MEVGEGKPGRRVCVATARREGGGGLRVVEERTVGVKVWGRPAALTVIHGRGGSGAGSAWGAARVRGRARSPKRRMGSGMVSGVRVVVRMRTRARRGAVWWLYGGSMVEGPGVAHEVVNGGEMVPGWGDQPTGEWSALGSLSREAGSASARPGPGLEGVSGTAQQAGAGKAGGLDLGWPSTEAGRAGITRYAITSQLRPGSINYPSLYNHCIDTPIGSPRCSHCVRSWGAATASSWSRRQRYHTGRRDGGAQDSRQPLAPPSRPPWRIGA